MNKIIYINERSILTKVKDICLENIETTDYVVDMTVGNGYDTLFLCKLTPKGIVFGFDIQKQAIENTTALLKENNLNNCKLFLESHENINKKLIEYKGKIKLILFNLGYLPKSNKSIMTNHKSTLTALINSFDVLKNEGLILIVFYPHEEGKKEAKTIKDYLNKENIFYTEYHNTDNINAPYLMVIKKTLS